MKNIKLMKVIVVLALMISLSFSRNIQGIASNLQETITQQEAESIALEAVAGRILYTDFEHDDGKAIFYVHVLAGTTVKEVYINAVTGDIMDIDRISIPLVVGGLVGVIVVGRFAYKKYFKK